MKGVIHAIPMKQNLFMKIIIFLAIILTLTIKGLGQIQGGVYNEKKQGIANALIIAKDTVGTIIDSVRTDKRGFYEFRVLKKGKYNIEANAPGYTSKVFKNIIVLIEESTERSPRDDISSAIRLEIFLTPVKGSK